MMLAHCVLMECALSEPEGGLTWMTALKVSSMARQRALLPVMEPSAYCRPSRSTAGCTLAAMALSWKTLPIVIACRHRKRWHPAPSTPYS